MKKFLIAFAVLALSACTNGFAGRGPDPVQQQAWSLAGTRGSSMQCDYMPLSCDGMRSGGSPMYQAFPAEKNLKGISSTTAKKFGVELTPNGEAEWEAVFADVLAAEVKAGRISAPTYEAYAVAYNKPRDAANPINRGITPVGKPF